MIRKRSTCDGITRNKDFWTRTQLFHQVGSFLPILTLKGREAYIFLDSLDSCCFGRIGRGLYSERGFLIHQWPLSLGKGKGFGLYPGPSSATSFSVCTSLSPRQIQRDNAELLHSESVRSASLSSLRTRPPQARPLGSRTGGLAGLGAKWVVGEGEEHPG